MTFPLFFIHIPKTAGTSFRVAAEKYFGEQSIERNYGAADVATTPLVREWVLAKNDWPSFYRHAQASGARMYTGHVKALPAVSVFPLLQTITFVRDPVFQALSHYNHCVRWHGYQQPFDTFVIKRGNQQVFPLRGVPLQLLGFVGITEMYDDSLALFNQRHGSALKSIIGNVNDQKFIEEPDARIRELVATYYPDDLKMYNGMKSILTQRLSFSRQRRPWCHGAIVEKNAARISGYVCQADSEAPVTVVLKDENLTIGETQANLPVPSLAPFVLPGKGAIGFAFDVTGLENSSRLHVMVKETGQLLDTELKF